MPATYSCMRCRCDVPEPSAADFDAAVYIAGNTMRLGSGLVVASVNIARDRIYCATCSSGLKVCRVCGSTDEVPADVGAIFWRADDLCEDCFYHEKWNEEDKQAA